MQKTFAKFAKDESGATAIEYGLLAALMGTAVIAAAPVIRDGLNNGFGNLGTSFEGGTTFNTP